MRKRKIVQFWVREIHDPYDPDVVWALSDDGALFNRQGAEWTQIIPLPDAEADDSAF